MPYKTDRPKPAGGTDVTTARLLDIAATDSKPYRVTGCTAYSSRSPSHAWAVYSLTRGAVVVYINGVQQNAQWFRNPEHAHARFREISQTEQEATSGHVA